MTHAYDEMYLEDAMANLGEMADYAANVCAFDMDTFWSLFISSGIARRFASGEPKIIVGMSGTELACHILEQSGLWQKPYPEPSRQHGMSAAYWGGWILAYTQWLTGYPFKVLLDRIGWQKIMKLYPTLHEAPEDKFVEIVRTHIQQTAETALQRQRKICGLSQRELAERSGINLRTLQQYETGAKDISKAAFSTVMGLAKALHCSPESLLL